MQIFDSHIHLGLCSSDDKLDDYLGDLQVAGIIGMLDLGTDVKSSVACVQRAEKHELIYAGVGIHPHDAAKSNFAKDMAELENLTKSPQVKAIGEAGLDYYRNISPPEVQKVVFQEHIRLAIKTKLPLVVHDRQAHDDVMLMLDDESPEKVVLHCYSGDLRMAQWAAERGYYMGFGGSSTYEKSNRLKIIEAIPPELVLLETDAPYLTPHPYREKTNHPRYLSIVAEHIAPIWGMTPVQATIKTAINARRFLGL